MDKELFKKIAIAILEHYEEDDGYFLVSRNKVYNKIQDDGYSRDVHALFKTPAQFKCTNGSACGVDLDVVFDDGEKIKAYWHLDGAGSANKTLQGSDGRDYNIKRVEKWRISED